MISVKSLIIAGIHRGKADIQTAPETTTEGSLDI